MKSNIEKVEEVSEEEFAEKAVEYEKALVALLHANVHTIPPGSLLACVMNMLAVDMLQQCGLDDEQITIQCLASLKARGVKFEVVVLNLIKQQAKKHGH